MYQFLPGLVDYCLGLREWQAGNYRESLEYLKLAAGWGSKGAQYSLGLIYYGGRQGVARDRARGIAWLKLADERHDDAGTARVLQSAVKHATPAQRKRAQVMFLTMRKRYGDKVAAARAWRHLVHRREYFQSKQVALFISSSRCVTPVNLPKGVQPTPFCMFNGKFSQIMESVVGSYFKGYVGKVRVGSLKALPASAASTGR